MPSIFMNITQNISSGFNISHSTDNADDDENDSKKYVIEIIFLSFICIIVLMCCFVCFVDVIYNCKKNITKKITKCCFALKNSYMLCCFKKTHEETTAQEYDFLVKNCLIIDKLNKEDDCPICLDKLNETVNGGDKLLKIKACGHVFHKNCIYPWFDVQFKDNKDSLNCPLCRESVNILWEKPIRNISEMSNASGYSDVSYYND